MKQIKFVLEGESPTLDLHKTHGHYGISIRMVRLCNLTITKPLSIIYKRCLQQEVFQDEGKKGNTIPVHK